ncbi:phospholipid/cholesterol/gamma-HCH transport system substrate-binding protein [Halopolyspora algeriensis]|uniref:Phospholipid/cholesterol/gamma-HCH transport system substrate-binding protein n=1 Tax=Halopolyspora algeriensis TaxID=1500506 RepID=A0A368VTK3_9ACTN|nr:MlaD family protein [Halopolyspora algeriensis]RCW44526.1 phospholipid/cholesterol/gamma-HCH transport system substrate-binding protein [Halopolyspora algeriensis]TQM55886.1 phospholipid/cholesterol/gamma-HCH transport system substrate-binding protein [Halopolyspora algeriensis]
MIARATRVRLALFLVIAVVGIGYTGAQYAGLDRLFGGDGYTVTVRMADSGGVFTNAEVTYRGVAVGRVVGMRLTNSGIATELHIESSAPKIPADTRAAVANRSAIGEQYVDLRPDDNRGPYLTEGSVIPERRTTLPPAPESLLVHLDRLVSSIPTDSLRTAVDEAGAAFRGTGPDLQRILDSADSFIATAHDHLPQTTGLIGNSNVVLRTQQDQSRRILSFSKGARQIAAQLEKSDPDLRTLIEAAPAAGKQIDRFLHTSGNDLGALVANLLTTTRITDKRLPAMEQMLVALPVIAAFSPSASQPGNDSGHLAATLNFFNPISCTEGYEGTKRRPGSVTTPAPTNYDLHCAEPSDSPINVRGARNAPSPGVPGEPVPHPPPLPLAGSQDR